MVRNIITVCILVATLFIVACAPMDTVNEDMTQAVFTTSMGEFTVELELEKAPITAGNFKKLAQEGFFDGLVFHRVIDGFMIQGGDPNGDGTGGPGYTIEDEFHPDLSNTAGTLSMANRGPNTGGSQFFINVADNSFLDYNKPPLTSKHAVFGRVVAGYDVVTAISQTPTGSQDRPVTPVVIEKVTIQ